MKKLLFTAAALLATGIVAAQDYPTKPITIVVPFSAGGPTDKVARDLAEALRKPLGNATIIIENVGGAGGTLGATKVARAAPDGYTLLLHHIGMATSPALYRNLPYKTLEDFEYLGMINEVPMTLIGKPTLPANNYAELVKWLEANKGKINLANAGLGAASHLCGLLLQSSLKIDMQTVPYKGTGAGDDRPARRPGRHHVRPDHQHHRADRGRQGQGLRRHHAQAADDAGAGQAADARRVGAEGLQRLDLARRCTRRRARRRRCSTRSTRRCKAALKDAEFIKREEALGAVVVTDARIGARRAQEVRRGRDQQVGPGDQGGGAVRRLTSRD